MNSVVYVLLPAIVANVKSLRYNRNALRNRLAQHPQFHGRGSDLSVPWQEHTCIFQPWGFMGLANLLVTLRLGKCTRKWATRAASKVRGRDGLRKPQS